MSALPILIALCMAAVLVVLALGLINLVRGGDEESARRSNKLMSWRVALQGAAVLLLGLLMLLSGKG